MAEKIFSFQEQSVILVLLVDLYFCQQRESLTSFSYKPGRTLALFGVPRGDSKVLRLERNFLQINWVSQSCL